jgi:hypothetical protein
VFALMMLGWASVASAWSCETSAGEVASLEGSVEIKSVGSTDWQTAKLAQRLCVGDTITVRAPGRAAVVLSNQVLIRLDQNSTLVLHDVIPNADARLDLEQGIVHVISRWRKKLGVMTPFINALVDGTEFTVLNREGLTRVAVSEGQVRAKNSQGEAVLRADQAAQATSQQDKPMYVKVRPLEAVAWAIYYPQIIWFDQTELSNWPADIAQAVQNAQQASARGQHAQALQVLLGIQASQRPKAVTAMLAATHLSLGQVNEAKELLQIEDHKNLPEFLAVRSVLHTARNQTETALSQANDAFSKAPASATVALAQSYAFQGNKQLQLALEAARCATQLAPRNPVAWARRAELELSSAQLKEGEKSARTALSLQSDAYRAQALVGMAQLLSGQTEAALQTLDAAVAADSTDPLARFARGMARIRQGHMVQGREDVELAGLLDPSNAELRAYLGRAYLEENRSKVARDQFELAKRLDAASPTPWFFDAIQRLREDDALGALAASAQAQKLNDGREVIRPSDLTMADLSSRSIQKSQAYTALGENLLAQNAAAQALGEDPLDSQALQAVAQTLSNDDTAEAARNTAMTQAMLRQPIGQWPIPPQFLAPSIPGIEGPRMLALDESSQLFNRSNRKAAATVLVGTRDTRGLSALGAWNDERWQLDLSGFNYTSDQDVRHDNTKLDGIRLHTQFSPQASASLHFEVLHTKRSAGEVYTPLLSTGGNSGRSDDYTLDRVLVGTYGEISPQTSWTALVAHSEEESRIVQIQNLINPSIPFEVNFKYILKGSSLGLNFNHTHAWGLAQIGGDYFSGEGHVFSGAAPVGQPIILMPTTTHRIQNNTVYGYTSIYKNPDSPLKGYAGLRHVELRRIESDPTLNSLAPDLSKTQPALGLEWSKSTNLRLRGAWYQTLTTANRSHTQIEPVLFNGFIRDPDTPLSGAYGKMSAFAIDIAQTSLTPILLEASQHRFNFNDGICQTSVCNPLWQTTTFKAASNYQLTPNAHIGAEWIAQDTQRRDFATVGQFATHLDTETAKILTGLRITPSWRLQTEFEHVNQKGQAGSSTEKQKSSFWTANFSARVKLNSEWSFKADAKNIFNRQFRYEEAAFDNPASITSQPPRRILGISAQWQMK